MSWSGFPHDRGVSDSSKLQIQKQITTLGSGVPGGAAVFPIVQSYKFKSKSQHLMLARLQNSGVSDSSKLQIQKQITTPWAVMSRYNWCFR